MSRFAIKQSILAMGVFGVTSNPISGNVAVTTKHGTNDRRRTKHRIRIRIEKFGGGSRTALARSKKYVTPIVDVESRVVKSFDWLFDLNLEGGTPTWIRSDVFGYESPTGSMVRKATRI